MVLCIILIAVFRPPVQTLSILYFAVADQCTGDLGACRLDWRSNCACFGVLDLCLDAMATLLHARDRRPANEPLP